MQRNLFLSAISLILLLAVFGAGCRRAQAPRVTPPQPPRPPAADTPDVTVAAPTVSLSASPGTIERGEQTTLSWRTTDATSIVISGGIGNVSEAGSIVVSPTQSTTYTAVARGPGGDSQASARVTVVSPRPVVEVATDSDLLQQAIDQGRVKPIFFAYDKSDLSPESMDTLRENARIFRMYPRARLIIEGHCDERGTEEYNLALGDRRALAAHDYLIQLGVDAAQMEPISFGEERPFDQDKTEAAYAKNRRAHFTVRR